ncbi:hypothetical protein V2J09_014117 [Rumex salicifolius]
MDMTFFYLETNTLFHFDPQVEMRKAKQSGGAQAVTGSDYMKLLKQHKPGIVWEKNIAKHYFVYNDDQQRQHAVFYPSLLSISTRLEEARSSGAINSIWEIGQGLDSFFDIL